MTQKQEQVITRIEDAIDRAFADSEKPSVVTPDLSAPESAEYVNLDAPNPRFRIEGEMTQAGFEELRQNLESENPTFEEILQFPILDNIVTWLKECGLPETLFYISFHDGLLPCTTPELVAEFARTPEDRRVFAHQLLGGLTGPSQTKQHHLREVIIAFLGVHEHLGKETYTNAQAMRLCAEVANLISTWRRMNISTKSDVTDTVLTGRRTKLTTRKGGAKRGEMKREEAEMWMDRAFKMALEKRAADPYITQKDLAAYIVDNWKGARSLLPQQERIAQWIRQREREDDPSQRIPPKKKRN